MTGFTPTPEAVRLTITAAEQVIRDLAATVVNQAANRITHPSYGYTKTSIRTVGANMDGAIGLYMVMSGQATHASIPTLAHFVDQRTTDRVAEARAALEDL